MRAMITKLGKVAIADDFAHSVQCTSAEPAIWARAYSGLRHGKESARDYADATSLAWMRMRVGAASASESTLNIVSKQCDILLGTFKTSFAIS